MAASDAFYRSQPTLNKVFAWSSIIMLVTVVWMFADDFNRPYKKDQRTFRTVEEELNKRATLQLAPDAPTAEKIVASEKEVVAARKAVDQLKPIVGGKIKKLIPERADLETKQRGIKAEYDSLVSYFNIAVEQAGPDSADAKKKKAAAEKSLLALDEVRPVVEAKIDEINRASQEEHEIEGGRMSLAKAEDNLKRLETSHKKLTGDFDRFLKQTAQKQWTWEDSFRALPVIDGFASPVKIKQTFHDDLPIDYGGFKYVTRYDRCTTCHLGIDKPSYDRASIARLTENPADDKDLQAKMQDAIATLTKRQETNTDKKQDVNILAAKALVPKQVPLSDSLVTAFAAHPRLDLFVDPLSPHPADKFGCSICHGGQGSATGFVDATHTPNDSPTMDEWKKKLDWRSIHDWEFPMYPKRFAEAACVKCHHQVEDLVRDNRVEAEKLVKGYHLVKDLGCYGCHEIYGNKSGRPVGPDLRLETDPPVESLPAAERAKRLADTTNPDGTQRKVGPSLFRISEKTTPEWSAKWLKAPRTFRPDTKMPHFYLQANNVDEALPDDQKKYPDVEIQAVTHYLFGKSKSHLSTISTVAKRTADEVAADTKLVDETTAKLATGELLGKAKRAAEVALRDAKARLAVKDQPLPVAESVTVPAGGQADRGRQHFATKGCVACHKHEGIETAGPAFEGKPQPALVGDSYFGPELSRMAAKLKPNEGQKWLVQWLMNPMVHSPRTLMPSVHLTLAEATDVATWLLSQPVKPDAEWDSVAVAAPDDATLNSMLRMYLRKAGLTTKEIEKVVKDGFSTDELDNRALDADEQMLAGPLDGDKRLTYIGKKAVSNLGCYACHNIPGFESAKPIGVGLNDWGKKDVDRIAYEDGNRYVKERFHTVELRDDPKDHSKPAEDWKPGTGEKPLEKFAPYETSKQPPYEKYFAEMLGHGHKHREGFLHLKLMSPRSYDYNRVRDWNDRLRMPQFKFARTKIKEGESAEAYRACADKEEADGREAAMTFILGLIAEPVPTKFINQPKPERLAEIKGRHVIEKFNCASCHLIRPGQYELSLSNEIVKGDDGKPVMETVTDKDGKESQVPLTQRKATLARLQMAHAAFVGAEAGDPKDRPYPEHNAWRGTAVIGDKITARAILGVSAIDADNVGPSMRMTSAVTFPNAEGVNVTLPAETSFGVPFYKASMKEVAKPLGGTFALKLKEYLSAQDPAKYGDQLPYGKIDDEGGQSLNGYAALPPSLLQEGERVQPAWLFQFLLNPKPIRKIPPLQMPKFSLSEADATALVDYFAAISKNTNPGIGLSFPYAKVPERDDAYLLKRTKEYVERLKANNLYDARVNEMKPIWERVAKEQLTVAEGKVAAYKAAKDDPKAADAQKEVDALKSQLGGGDYAAQKAQWEQREAYVGDAWKLVTYSGNLCITCHKVGPVLPNEYRAPNLENSWERLRPEWTERWIAYPQRMMPYAALMQPNYKAAEAKKHSDDAKVFIGTPDDQIRASRDLLMMFNAVADWPIIKYRAGPTAFGPLPVAPAAAPAGDKK